MASPNGWSNGLPKMRPPWSVSTTFSFFRIRYFKTHGPKPDWANFLDDFQRHWPTDRDIYVDFVRDGLVGNGAERMARL